MDAVEGLVAVEDIRQVSGTRGRRPIRRFLATLGAGVLFAAAAAGPAAAQDDELSGGGGLVPVLLPPEICALFISVFGEAPLLCAPLPNVDAAPPSSTTTVTIAALPVPSGPGAGADAAPPTAVSSKIEVAAPAPDAPTPIRAVQRVLTTIGQGFQLQGWIAVISLVLLTGYVGATSAPGRKTDDPSR